MICSGEVLLLLYYSKKEYACESGGERLPLRFLHLFGVAIHYRESGRGISKVTYLGAYPGAKDSVEIRRREKRSKNQRVSKSKLGVAIFYDRDLVRVVR
jgi:hypothetical protein